MEAFVNARIKRLRITHPFLQESQLLCRAKQEYLKSDEYKSENVAVNSTMQSSGPNRKSTGVKRKLTFREKLDQLSDDFTVNGRSPKNCVNAPSTSNQVFEHAAGLDCQKNNSISTKNPLDVYDYPDNDDDDENVPPLLSSSKKRLPRKTVNPRKGGPKASKNKDAIKIDVSVKKKPMEEDISPVEIKPKARKSLARNRVTVSDNEKTANLRKKSKNGEDIGTASVTTRATSNKKKKENVNAKRALSLTKKQNENKKNAVCEVIASKDKNEPNTNAAFNVISTEKEEDNKNAESDKIFTELTEKQKEPSADVIAETQLLDFPPPPGRDDSDDSTVSCGLMTRFSVQAMTSARFKSESDARRITAVEEPTTESHTENVADVNEKNTEINAENVESIEGNIDFAEKDVQTVEKRVETVEKRVETVEKQVQTIEIVNESVQTFEKTVQTVDINEEECAKIDKDVVDSREIGDKNVCQTTTSKIEMTTNTVCSLSVICNGNDTTRPVSSSTSINTTNGTANQLAIAVDKFMQSLQCTDASKIAFGGQVYWKLEITNNISSQRLTKENKTEDNVAKNNKSSPENDAQDVKKLLVDDSNMEEILLDDDKKVDTCEITQSQFKKPRLSPKKVVPKKVTQKTVYFPDIIEEEEYPSLEENSFDDDSEEENDLQSTILLSDSDEDEGNDVEEKMNKLEENDQVVPMHEVEEEDWNNPFRRIDTRIDNLLHESKQLDNMRNAAWVDATRIFKRMIQNIETKNSTEDEWTDSDETTLLSDESEEDDSDEVNEKFMNCDDDEEEEEEESNGEATTETQMNVEECQTSEENNLQTSLLELFSDPMDDCRTLYSVSPRHQMGNSSSDDFFVNI